METDQQAASRFGCQIIYNKPTLTTRTIQGTKQFSWLCSQLVLIIVLYYVIIGQALANPTGQTVINGSATFTNKGSTLTVTNTPNTIISWGNFVIGTGQTTVFQQ